MMGLTHIFTFMRSEDPTDVGSSLFLLLTFDYEAILQQVELLLFGLSDPAVFRKQEKSLSG